MTTREVSTIPHGTLRRLDALTGAARVALGEYIRTERERRKVSLTQLAKAIGVSVPFMSDAERGRRGLTPARLGQISTYLGLDQDKAEKIGHICPACRGTGRR